LRVGSSTRARLGLKLSHSPPVAEQIAISSYLEGQTSRIAAILSKTNEQIDLLHEYRSALITAAVTGQLDVREHEEKLEALAG
jgi:type I restriction enzyme S subunit